VPSQDLFVRVLTVGEIERGIERQRDLNPEFAERITSWLDTILRTYESQILAVDIAVARRWGRLSYLIGNKGIDLAMRDRARTRPRRGNPKRIRFRADGRISFQSFEPAVGSEPVRFRAL
jgi:predicted nucleic acid-binding protein